MDGGQQSSECPHCGTRVHTWGFTFEVDSIHEHEHHIMWDALQEVGDVTIGGVLHPLVDLVHRDQRDRL